THSNLAIAYFDRECVQIHFIRPLVDLSGANVESGVMPWALHVEMLERSFGQWAEAVCAKFLKRIKALVVLRDRYHLPVNFGAQGFSLAQAVGFRDRDENHISLLIRSKICHGQMQGAFRRRRAAFMPADADAGVGNETASQITGYGQKRDNDEA